MSRKSLSMLAKRSFVSSATNFAAKDPIAAAFFSPQIQAKLRALTGLNYAKVFRVAKRGQKISAPSYSFMTDKELSDARKEAEEKAYKKLQMPPVMQPRVEKVDVISEDPAIRGHDAAKYVFTDITYGIHDRDRIIVVREPDGTLRKAMADERDRLNQIYFPREGRRIKPPKLFDEDQLAEILGRDRYLYVLDRNCVQFEPDHPSYIRTAHIVYNHINKNGDYDVLESTRHFGPMVFYLTWEKMCDDIIVYYIKQKNLANACMVVQLFKLIHPEAKFDAIEDVSARNDQVELMRSYISKASNKETKLHTALESMLEVEAINRETQENLVKQK